MKNESFGIMDPGYFRPRSELLAWVNSLLHLRLSKIQQLGSGAVYCQLLDLAHPGKVALHKVNWKAKFDYQFITNLKIFQASLQKVGVKKHLQIEKLAKAKYQDNLQLIQWLKRYFEVNDISNENYNPETRRYGELDLSFVKIQKPERVQRGLTERAVETSNRQSVCESTLLKKKQQNKQLKQVVQVLRGEGSAESKLQKIWKIVLPDQSEVL